MPLANLEYDPITFTSFCFSEIIHLLSAICMEIAVEKLSILDGNLISYLRITDRLIYPTSAPHMFWGCLGRLSCVFWPAHFKMLSTTLGNSMMREWLFFAFMLSICVPGSMYSFAYVSETGGGGGPSSFKIIGSLVFDTPPQQHEKCGVIIFDSLCFPRRS